MAMQSSTVDAPRRADRGFSKGFWIIAAVVVAAMIAFFATRSTTDNATTENSTSSVVDGPAAHSSATGATSNK